MNPRLDLLAPSLIRAIHAQRRPGDIDLSLGEPVLRPDPEPFEAAMRRVREEGTPYTPNAGLASLRSAIARHDGIADGSPEHVCITVGSEEALYLALKTLIDPAHDEVLVVEPCYLAYPKLCHLEGIDVRAVALSPDDDFAPRAEALLEALGPRTRALILNSPCNPTGRVWPAAELRALAAGLANRTDPVWVIMDEVYRELYYGAHAPASLARLHPHTVTIGSLSKSNALTGMRVGWMIADPAVVTQAVKVHGLVNTAAPTFSQWVAEAIFDTPEGLTVHRQAYAERRRQLLELADANGLELIPPEGAFYAFLRLPERLAADSLSAAARLLDDRRVLAVPGIAFGAAGEGWLRISWVAAAEDLREGLERMAGLLTEHS